MTRVGVIGLGYVGLPLAISFAEAGVEVVGLDVDRTKVEAITAGRSYVEDVESQRLASLVDRGLIRATGDATALRGSDAIIICLPTPLDEHDDPDLSFVVAGAEAAAANLVDGTLVVLESTTYPGTTRELVQPVLEREGRVIGRDVFLAFCSERLDPGNARYSVRNTPKVIGGITPACSRRAAKLYRRVVSEVHIVSTPESAEMSKLLENIFRAVNIALVNELAILCDRMGIDIWEAIAAASTKPFGFMPFWPGPGLGGHCVPIDPFYLAWRAKAFGLETEFVELAGRINREMPGYALSRVARALNGDSKALKGSRILLLGMAYKPNVSDLRESPSVRLLELLRMAGADVSYHDPHVPRLPDHRLSSQPLDAALISAVDCVVIATNHAAADLQLVVDHASRVVDLRNAVRQRLQGRASGPVPANVDVL